MNPVESLLAPLLLAGWTLRAIAYRLDITERTLYRWRDKGTDLPNQERIAILNYFRPPDGAGARFGVCYLRPEGSPYVKIGETQDLNQTVWSFRRCHPVPVHLIAWHRDSRSKDHHQRWEALSKPDCPGWFEYHPDMEQK